MSSIDEQTKQAIHKSLHKTEDISAKQPSLPAYEMIIKNFQDICIQCGGFNSYIDNRLIALGQTTNTILEKSPVTILSAKTKNGQLFLRNSKFIKI